MIVDRQNPNWARLSAHDFASISFADNFFANHDGVKREMSRKLAKQESSAQPPYLS
jgi:hypothetical protein